MSISTRQIPNYCPESISYYSRQPPQDLNTLSDNDDSSNNPKNLYSCMWDQEVLGQYQNRIIEIKDTIEESKDPQIDKVYQNNKLKYQEGELGQFSKINSDDTQDRFLTQILFVDPCIYNFILPQPQPLPNNSSIDSKGSEQSQIQRNQDVKFTNQNSISNIDIGPGKFIDQLKQINRKLQQEDFSFLFKDRKALKVLKFITEKRYMLPTQFRQHVKRFLDLVNSRIEYFPFAQIIYSELLNCTQKLSMVYQYNGSRRNVSLEQNQLNRIYQNLVQEVETKPRRQAIYYIQQKNGNKRISLGQHMAQYPQFFKNKKWRQIMDIVVREIQKVNLQQVRHDNQQIVKIIRKLDYSKKIYKKITLNMGCLGCTDFFIVNWNVYDQTVNQGKVVLGGKVLDMISKKSTEEDKRAIITKTAKQICALLNSGGGVILFNCETIYLSMIPRGEFITQQQGKEIERIIKTEIIKRLSPQIQFGTNVVLSFMRMLKDPIIQDKQYHIKQIPIEMFVEGLFLVRILVRPTTKVVYAYSDDKGQFYQAFRYKSIVDSQIQTKKVDKPSTSVNISQDWVTSIMNKPYLQFDHDICLHSKYCLKVQQLPVQKQPEQLQTDDIEKKYHNATAMVVKKQNFEQFKRRLKKLEFEHYCQFPFKNSKVKGANATVILYHNKTNTQIASMINYNSEFEFGGRNTVSVSITDHIKLVNRLNKNSLPYEQFQNLQLWIDHQFKGDLKFQLEMCTCKNEYKEQQYYLRVKGPKGVKKCTLFVYLVANHFSQRAQLRNPKEEGQLQTYFYQKKEISSVDLIK